MRWYIHIPALPHGCVNIGSIEVERTTGIRHGARWVALVRVHPCIRSKAGLLSILLIARSYAVLTVGRDTLAEAQYAGGQDVSALANPQSGSLLVHDIVFAPQVCLFVLTQWCVQICSLLYQSSCHLSASNSMTPFFARQICSTHNRAQICKGTYTSSPERQSGRATAASSNATTPRLRTGVPKLHFYMY
ncbi:hypothetical protein CYLTODRAFT_180364 [Cylindrobasidium torrendii FP15055 ss-10]|uniref:Uncharacterized protein n=1 Tax=Cylindrobasidium torrendii FP15055 ss-10 TaxID=1314674 RepID=A0A0D7AYN0_9AGAR|nr:hypothetical protein CYLTODRAFT_180364 [Cylindrobasidium torrendii FP15055 ss-10]